MTAAVHESWLTTLDDPADTFGASLTTRARKRTVLRVKEDKWVVKGDEALGDAYRAYTVRFDGRRYHCSCRGHAFGQARKFCSHALAVLMDRKANPVMAGVGEDEGEVPATEVPATSSVASYSLPGPRDDRWGQPPLPAWVTEFREHQVEAAVRIVREFESGAEVVLVDAPTGSGKSLLAEMVRRLLGVRAVYVCSTKTLQDQLAHDFPYAQVLKGRSNYPTADLGEQKGDWAITAADCTKTEGGSCAKCPGGSTAKYHCNWCHPVSRCPYEQAKVQALKADLAIVNTSYFLTEANGPAKFAGADLVIVDEADLLESELMGQVEVRIGDRLREELGVEEPKRKTKVEAWGPWVAGEAIPKVKKALGKLPQGSADVKVVRKVQRLQRLLDRLKKLERGLERGEWVYDGKGDIVFRPVRVDGLAPEMLWRHGARFLCMTATLISDEEFAESLGLGDR